VRQNRFWHLYQGLHQDGAREGASDQAPMLGSFEQSVGAVAILALKDCQSRLKNYLYELESAFELSEFAFDR